MSSYHSSFFYLNKNSYDDFNLQIVHFESGDSGETDSYLSQDAVYTDSPRGTRRTMYGTKYNQVASLTITVMQPGGGEFSIAKTRAINKWLTGSNQYSWMDLYVGDEVKYRMHCFVQDVKPYKMDSRIVGFVITVESSSPWCYSPLQTQTYSISGTKTVKIDNLSDDIYTYVNMKATFQNSTGESLSIKNTTLNETTTVNNLVSNEKITLSDSMFITSDKTTRVFGSDFNYVWPRLKSGVNNITISGTGTITFEYIFPMKVADCVGDLNAVSDTICSEDGTIIVDTLDWNRIINTPTTLSGYKIKDAYTKTEINNMLANFTQKDVYTKDEIDELLSKISDNNKGNNIYIQSDEPTDAIDGSLWIDTDEEYAIGGSSSNGIYVQSEEPSNAHDGALWIDTDEFVGNNGEVTSIEVDKTELETMLQEVLK